MPTRVGKMYSSIKLVASQYDAAGPLVRTNPRYRELSMTILNRQTTRFTSQMSEAVQNASRQATTPSIQAPPRLKRKASDEDSGSAAISPKPVRQLKR